MAAVSTLDGAMTGKSSSITPRTVNQLMAVSVSGGEKAFQVGVPAPLFKVRMLLGPVTATGFMNQYDVAPDGQRFLLNVPVEDTPISPVTVVLNWVEELKRLVPAN